MRIASVVLALGLALSSAPAFARGGGYHANKPQKKKIQALGSESRTGNKEGNAEKADPEAKIVDEPDGPSYGNEVVDPPTETAKPKPKPKTKTTKS